MAITAAKLMVVVDSDVAGAVRGLQGVTRGMDGLNSKAQAVGQKLTTYVTLPILGVGAAATKMAVDFDTNMNVLQATSGATSDEIEALREQAKALGNDLTLPGTSAADAAEAMLELSKAGLKVNDVMNASRGVLQLSTAGQLSNAQAAEITANALNAFNLEGEEAVRVADLLAASASSSSGEVVDMADALKMSAAVAASANIPIEDLVTAISEMANAGIKGSDSGTSLKQMLLALMAPTDKAKKLMKELGISVYDAQGNMLPMEGLIGEFSTALSGLTQEQRNAALATIFGSDAVRSANVVLMGGVESFNAMKDAVTDEGAASELAAARTKGWVGELEALKNAVETAMLAGIEPLTDDIGDVAGAIADAVTSFSELDEATRGTIAKTALLTAGLGPGILAVNTMQGAVTGLATALGISVGALGAVALAVVAVGAAMAEYNEVVTKRQEAVRSTWPKFFDDQVKSGKNAIQTLEEYEAAQGRVRDVLNNTDPILRLFVGTQGQLSASWSDISAGLQKTSSSYGDYQEAASRAAKAQGLFIDENGDLIEIIEGEYGSIERLVQKNYLLNVSQYNLVHGVQDAADAMQAQAWASRAAGDAAAAAEDATKGLTGEIENLDSASMEATDILNTLASSLNDAGWAADAAQQVQDALAISLGETTEPAVRLKNDVELLSQAFAAGTLSQEEYTRMMQQAKDGTLAMSAAQRENIERSLEQADAIKQATAAAQEYQAKQFELAMSFSSVWQNAFDSYESGVARLEEENAKIQEKIAELKQKIRESSDPEQIRQYRQEIRGLREDSAQTAEEMANLADEMQRTIEVQLAQSALGMLKESKDKGLISWDEYMTASSQVAETFGLVNDQGMALSTGLMMITTALEEGRLPAESYDEALKALAQDAQDGKVDFEALLGQFGAAPPKTDTATTSTDKFTEGLNNAALAAEETMSGLVDFDTQMTQTAETAKQAAETISQAFERDWHDLGLSIGQGIAQGVYDSIDQVAAAATEAAQAAESATAETLESKSPSHRFHALGVSAMEGFAGGIRDRRDDPLYETVSATHQMLAGAVGQSATTTSAPAPGSMPPNFSGSQAGIQQPIQLIINIAGEELRRIIADGMLQELNA